MRTLYTDMNIRLQIEDTELSVLNIAFERFFHKIPRHSHGHNSYELHYISHGYGTVIIDGVSYRITPETLYMTGPHVEHEQIPDTENPMSEYCLYFMLLDDPHRTRCPIMSLLTATPFWFGQDTQDIHSPLRMIFSEFSNCYTGYMTQVEILLKQCIVKLIRNYERPRKSESHFGPANLSDRKYIITEEYFLYEYQTLSLETLASKLGLSVRQTNRFIKKCYGKNFLQKRTEAKMSVASTLMLDGELSATDIAAELGYSSLEHFLAAFKRYYGMSTRAYRNSKINA